MSMNSVGISGGYCLTTGILKELNSLILADYSLKTIFIPFLACGHVKSCMLLIPTLAFPE